MAQNIPKLHTPTWRMAINKEVINEQVVDLDEQARKPTSTRQAANKDTNLGKIILNWKIDLCSTVWNNELT